MKYYLSEKIFDSTKELIRKMRITCLLLFVFASSVFAIPGSSQVAKVSISMKNATVSKVIDAIEKQTDYLFVYNKNEIDLMRSVSVDTNNQSVAEVLSEIFDKTNIVYAMEGSNIMLMPRSNIQQPGKQISGKITDKTKIGLPGVSVVVKGTTTGVTTDNDGNFLLQLPKDANILVFSFVGMKSQEISIAGKTSVNILLEEETTGVDEVVVIGYGTQKKADITGSVSLVSSKDLAKVAVMDPMQALQGKAAGVNITSVSGQPGSGYQIRIRGIQSIAASVQPIYVIDGVISESMSNINTNDIESISVLKDGASSAIYGARSANGVVLITTKQGNKNQAPVISFNSYMGISTQSNTRIKLLNSNQWLQLNSESLTNDGITGTELDRARGYTEADLQVYKDANGNYRNTDWMDQISQTGQMKYYDLSVRGGSENSTYYTSLSYQDQKGMIKSQTAQNINVRFNSTHKINKFIEFGNNLNIFVNKNAGLPDFSGSNSSNAPDPFLQAIRKSPLSEVTRPDGSYGINQNQNVEYLWMPPTVITNEYKRKVSYSGIVGNIYTKFNLAPGLSFTPKLGVTYSHDLSSFFIPGITIENTTDGSKKSELTKKSADNFHWQTDFMLNYEHTFNSVHNVSVILDYSQEEGTYENLNGKGASLPLNNIYYLNAADPLSISIQNGYSDWSIVSYLGRINYDYNGKYLFQATVRRDGTSRFAKQNRWGIFPSFSAGWRISKEKFFESLTGVVSDLKIRASSGTLGNANVSNYLTYSGLFSNVAIMNQAKSGGYTLTNAINQDVKWESTQKTNVGIDATFLKSKLYFTADYFKSSTTNMLWNKPLPVSAGKYGSPLINAGEMQNKGWEFELGFRDKKGDFSYDVSANVTSIRNKAIDLNGRDDRASGMVVGQPLYSYYGLTTGGVIKTQAQLDAYKTQLYAVVADGKFKAQLGDVMKKDIGSKDANGEITAKPDGRIDASDYTFIGKRYADFSYGFVTSLSYKRFSFQIQAQGVQGIDLPFRGVSLNYFGGGLPVNSSTVILDRWHATLNPNGNLPRLTRDDKNINQEFSDIWLSDASYLRINNVNFSWDVPENVLNRFLLKELRVYCSIQNLHTFTKFKGGDPDVIYSNGYNGANPADKIAQPITWTMGVKLSF